MTVKQQIICKHLDGDSNRAIASDLHISKNTVNKYVNEYDLAREKLFEQDPTLDPEQIINEITRAPKYDTSNRKRRKATEEITKLVDECLEENRNKIHRGQRKQIMKNVDIFEYIISLGYDISYPTVCNIIRERTNEEKEVFIRQNYEPGDCCEFDWGDVKLKIGNGPPKDYKMAVFTPPYSDRRYAKLYEHEDTAAFLSSHVDYFEFSQGIFRQMVYDNMRVAVRKFVGPSEKEPTEALLGISTYYGFSFRFCNIRSANEKGSVERSVEYVRRKAFAFPGKDKFDSLEAANEYLLSKLNELSEVHSDQEKSKQILFEEEKAKLRPLLPKYQCYKPGTAKIDKYSTFSFDTNHYSVPEELVGKKVELHIYTDYVVALYNGQKVARHPRNYGKKEWTIDILHYLKALRKKPGALARSTALLQADTQTKNIYYTYYNGNSKEFLQVLEIIREKGVYKVKEALEALAILSPGDYSVDKVKTICEIRSGLDEAKPQSDHISDVTRTTLVNYDILMALAQQKAGAANG